MTLVERYLWARTNPSDIAEHVPVLARYGAAVERITEFGVRGGVSTTAWLKAAPKRLTCYDRNVPECLEELTRIATATEFRFVQADTRTGNIEPTDLLFLDTTHNDETLRPEMWNNEDRVTTYIILHDTELFGWNGEEVGCGIKRTLIEFLLAHPHWRIERHYPNSYGLTILKRDGQ